MIHLYLIEAGLARDNLEDEVDLLKAEQLSEEIEKIEVTLDEIEDNGGEDFIGAKSQIWMDTYKQNIQLKAELYIVVHPNVELQFNEDKTRFRIVTNQNRGTKFW